MLASVYCPVLTAPIFRPAGAGYNSISKDYVTVGQYSGTPALLIPISLPECKRQRSVYLGQIIGGAMNYTETVAWIRWGVVGVRQEIRFIFRNESVINMYTIHCIVMLF